MYLYGHKRRTDFLPVGGNPEEEVLERGYESLSDSDEEGPGLEYACEENTLNQEAQPTGYTAYQDDFI